MWTITGKVAGPLMATALLAAGGVASPHHVVATHHAEQTVGGAPSWVVPGTRLTHYSAVATLPEGTYELVEDPNGPLSDPVTGKRYRETYTASAQAAAQGGAGSGDGFIEVTVAAVEGDDVVVSRSLYVNEPLTQTRSIGSTTAERVAGARVDGAWIRPDLLATMKTGEMGSVLVLRGPVSVAGTTHDAVSLLDPTAGAYAFFAYDAATGVQLTSALRISAISGGPVQMSFTELRGTRQLATPGLGATVPGWLAARPELVYAGTQDFVNPLDPSSAPISSTVSWTTTFPQTGTTWAMYQTNGSVTMLGTPTSFTSSGVVNGAGPYWWDPTALAAMTASQTLDTDPHTGMTISVSRIEQGRFGPAVAISLAMPGFQAETGYDVATGVMVGQTVASTSSGLTTRIELQQMPAAIRR